MDTMACVLKIYPDWRGKIIHLESGDKIVPHELETRPVPKLEELEAAWALCEIDITKKTADDEKEKKIKAEMERIVRNQAISNLTAKGEI